MAFKLDTKKDPYEQISDALGEIDGVLYNSIKPNDRKLSHAVALAKMDELAPSLVEELNNIHTAQMTYGKKFSDYLSAIKEYVSPYAALVPVTSALGVAVCKIIDDTVQQPDTPHGNYSKAQSLFFALTDTVSGYPIDASWPPYLIGQHHSAIGKALDAGWPLKGMDDEPAIWQVEEIQSDIAHFEADFKEAMATPKLMQETIALRAKLKVAAERVGPAPGRPNEDEDFSPTILEL